MAPKVFLGRNFGENPSKKKRPLHRSAHFLFFDFFSIDALVVRGRHGRRRLLGLGVGVGQFLLLESI
jgi:hypothetical protein